jgi:outer membrane protein assembly factor BamB
MRLVLATALICTTLAARADWPQFRGGQALGHAAARLPLVWGNDKNLAWRTAIPGSGWSQPVVAGGRIYVTTAVSGGADRPKNSTSGVWDFSTMGRPTLPKNALEWRVLCLDAADGRMLWSRTVVERKPEFGKHASNTYATETPCAAADTVWAFFGATGTLVALDRDGGERWRREFGPQKIVNQFGTGSSPVLHDERLVLQLYNEESATLVCLDAATGRDQWKADRSKGSSWATPVVWNNAGTPEVLAAGDKSLIAYALADGLERWRLEDIDTSFACSVVADAEGVYFGTSSPGSRSPAAAIAPGNLGDLTPPKGATQTAAIRWSRTKSGAGMPSPVVAGDLLFFFGDKATCLDKRTGTEKFRKRMPGGTTCVGSPLVVGDRIYVVNEKGTTLVLRAGPAFEVLGESTLGPGDEVFWASPAVAGDALLIRSSDALYCVRE